MGRSSGLWLVLAALAASPASAQSQGLVVRDGTLGSGPLEVGPGSGATYLITPEMGKQRDSNLFHSFSSFGIGTGETATFTGPGGIDHVISRVTGGGESRIEGTLRSTLPDADVWLLNPSGVVFGEGAQLDVPGSFHASTGDYVGFEGSLERFYSDPSRPSVLSTAPPAAFGFLGEGPAAPISLAGAALAVPEGETLSLVAGEVVLDAATLTAENGRVNLAAVASAGEVVLGPADVAEPLDVSGFETLGEIRLQARADVGSLVDVSGDSPGSVFIRGGQLVIEGHRRAPRFEDDESGRSRILAENQGPGPGGSLSIETSESVLVDNGLLSVNTTSAGNAGSIYVESPEVTFQNGPGWLHDFVNPADPRNQPHAIQVGARAETSSSGAAGTIEIVAEEKLTLRNGVSVSAQAFGAAVTGDAGTITIDAGSMEVLDRSDVSGHATQGNAGAIEIDVAGSLRLDGAPVEDSTQEEDAAPFAEIWTTSLSEKEQNGGAPGRIDIEADSVELQHDTGIQSYCDYCTSKTNADDRPADAGLIRIVANRVVIEGASAINPSLVNAGANGDGDAGRIEIETGSLEVRRGVINTSTGTPGEGAGGSITIDADSVVITEQGLVNASTSGAGAGGTITVDARTVLIERQGIMHAGTSGTGAAGTIDVTASESIRINGEGDPLFSVLRITLNLLRGLPPLITGIFSAGGRGTIHLDAPEITVTDGAFVTAASVGGGDAGDIVLSGERISIQDGAFVSSTSIPEYIFGNVPGGAAGSVTLVAGESIEIVGERQPGYPSQVASATLGSGAAGIVTLDAPRILVDGGSVATTALPFYTGEEGEGGGDILVRAEELLVRGGGRIDASSFIAGPGGNIDVTASESIVVEGEGSGVASRTGAAGDGGTVALKAPVIEMNAGGEVSARSEADPLREDVSKLFGSLVKDGRVGELPAEATGRAGGVELAADELRLFGGTIATNAEAADGGSVTIEAKDLVHLDAGVITAAVRDGAGGNITIDPEVVILEHGSRIVADAGTGSGGNIQITADNYFAFPGSVVDASSELGIDGIVEVSTPDVDLAGTLTALPASYLDAASLMRERCAARRSGERAGSFAVRGNGGIPAEPDGWLPATVSTELERGLAPTTERPSPSASAPRLARLGACQ